MMANRPRRQFGCGIIGGSRFGRYQESAIFPKISTCLSGETGIGFA
jgi:hypothetical protein